MSFTFCRYYVRWHSFLTIQVKCANYWPDIFGQEVTYGDVTVLNICSDKYADYIVTVFNLEKDVSNCFLLLC